MNFDFFEMGKKEISIVLFLTILFSFLSECYIVLLENSAKFYQVSDFDVANMVLSMLSFKHLLLFFVIFLIVFTILFNKDLRVKASDFLYKYRFILGAVVFVVCVIFEIHGSSIGMLNLSATEHRALLGIPFHIHVDEFSINTPFAFSQYYNNFSYFSDIIRSYPTDMFLVYAQPVLDVAAIFRPFFWGYLFLPQGKGLSFFWVGRLIALLLVSFELGMLITNKNKTLALSYALLVAFGPLVQWWFGVNSFVEMLVFGQLAIVLLNKFMTVDDFKKRLLLSVLIAFCAVSFTISIYPAWQVPVGYILLALGIWVIYKNWKNFNYSKQDLVPIGLFLLIVGVSLTYILTKSWDALMTSMNTYYPGGRKYYGGVDLYWGSANWKFFLDYMRTIFYPLTPPQRGIKIGLAYFVSFFPLSIILYSIVQFVQKRKDVLLHLLMIVYIFFIAYFMITFPEFVGKITLMSRSMSTRLLVIISLVDILLIIRSLSIIKPIEFLGNPFSKKSLAISFLLVGIVLFSDFYFMGTRFYSYAMLVVAFIIFGISFFFILNSAENKKAQLGFLCCVAVISLAAGGLANPIESGVDFYYDQPIIQTVSGIVDNHPDAIWVVGQELYMDEVVATGAHTLNSVNVYPNFDLFSKLDPNNESYIVYNRYSHLHIIFQDSHPTTIEIPPDSTLEKSDQLLVYLNVNDVQKLNISYVLTRDDLTPLSNDNITFVPIYADNGVNIYKIYYK